MVWILLACLALVSVTSVHNALSSNHPYLGHPGLNPFIKQQPMYPTTYIRKQGSYSAIANELVSTAVTKQDTISFDKYISKYNVVFENEAEKLRRHRIFMVNFKKVQEHNELYEAGSRSYRKGLNQYSHLTYEEVIKNHLGYSESGAARSKRSIGYYSPINPGKEPLSPNWVEKGVVNPIRIQGYCASSWAFSATSVIESQIKIKFGVLQQLSEQYLIDCDSTKGGAHGNKIHGCKGGLPSYAIAYVKHHGIALASTYPYTGQDGTCQNATPKTTYNVTSELFIRPGSDADLLNACAHIGPISVVIQFRPSFIEYEYGVYNDPCTGGEQRKHAMVLVGYGTEKDANGEDHDYWLLRNSWGTSWGEGGYIKMSRETNNFCSISSHGVFPVVAEESVADYFYVEFGEDDEAGVVLLH